MLTAEEIVSRMAAAYGQAESYVDNAQYHQRFTLRDDGIEYDVPSHLVSCAFVRPSRVRLNREVPAIEAEGLSATLTSNGDVLRAFISDHHGQVWETAAPEAVTEENLFASKQVHEALLPVPLENLYPQIDLLLATNERPSRLLSTATLKRLEDQKLKGSTCHRVQLVKPGEGPRVLWIDRQTHLLRRMDMPTSEVRATMDTQGVLTNLELWIEFHDAEMGLAIEDATFEMEVPQGAARVRELIAPPPPPPQWLGQTPEDFAFTLLDGSRLASDSLAGKVAVLDFWFTSCGPCQQSMPALETLHQAYRNHADVQFLAVSVDPPSVSDDQLRSTLEKWGGSMTVARDTDGHAEKQFAITGYPTTIVLGPEGSFQLLARGAKDSYKSWGETIDKLLAGENIAGQALAAHRQALEEFNAAVAAATIDSDEPANAEDESGIQTNAPVED